MQLNVTVANEERSVSLKYDFYCHPPRRSYNRNIARGIPHAPEAL